MDDKDRRKILTLSETVLTVSNDVALVSKTAQEKYDKQPEDVRDSGTIDHLYEAAAELEEIAQQLDDLHKRLQRVIKRGD